MITHSTRFYSTIISKLCLTLFILLLIVSLTAKAQQSSPATLERNKDVIEQFFELANTGNADDLGNIVREDYIEHADMPDYLSGLQEVIASNTATPIQADIEVERQTIRGDLVRMIAENDHVWSFAEVAGSQGRVARIDMFRLEDGMIAEHWSVSEQVEEERDNPNMMFAAGQGGQNYRQQAMRITASASAEQLAANRQAARLFYHYFEVADAAGLRTIMTEDYIQHNPGLPNGREALLGNMPTEPRTPGELPPEGNNVIIRILTEGDLVWIFVSDPSGNGAQFNQFRAENGVLTEHWGTYQQIPRLRQNDNTFFGFGRGPAPDYSR